MINNIAKEKYILSLHITMISLFGFLICLFFFFFLQNYHDKLVDLSWERWSNGNAAESAKDKATRRAREGTSTNLHVDHESTGTFVKNEPSAENIGKIPVHFMNVMMQPQEKAS